MGVKPKRIKAYAENPSGKGAPMRSSNSEGYLDMSALLGWTEH